MKKKLLMVALMSATMGLASCGQQPASSPEGSHASVSEPAGQSVESKESSAPAEVSSEAHVHLWGVPTYTWSEDYTECTATVVCELDPSHVITETVAATISSQQPASCNEEGSMSLVANFDNDVFGTYTEDIALPMVPHTLTDSDYKWNYDHTECTAKAYCTVCDDGIEETVTAKGVSDASDNPIKALSMRASFKTVGFADQTFDLEIGGSLTDDEDSYIVSSYPDKLVPSTAFIPSSVDDLPVTEIAMSAFYQQGVIEVRIPASVTTIGDEAFAYCEHLETIVFGGTKAQWGAITKGNRWSYATDIWEISCSDGILYTEDGIEADWTTDFPTIMIGSDEWQVQNEYYVMGILGEIESDKYGNCHLRMRDGSSIYLYGIRSADNALLYQDIPENQKPKKGDVAVFYGEIAYFQTTLQMKNARVMQLNGTVLGTIPQE